MECRARHVVKAHRALPATAGSLLTPELPRSQVLTELTEKGARPSPPWLAGPALHGLAGDEAGHGPRGLAFAVEKDVEEGKGGAEFAGVKEMVEVARAFGAGELELGKGLVEEVAAGTESPFDSWEEAAIEIVEAQNQIEGSGGKREGFQVGFDEQEAGEVGGDGVGSGAVGVNAVSGGKA